MNGSVSPVSAALPTSVGAACAVAPEGSPLKESRIKGLQRLRQWFPVRSLQARALEPHMLRTGFNLLPYRAAQAWSRKRRYSIELLCAAAAGFGLMHAMGYHAARETARATQRQTVLEQKLAALQPTLAQRPKGKARLQARTALQSQRNALTRLLVLLAEIATPDVQLNALDYEIGTGKLAGVAASPTALGSWLDQLKRAPCFSDIKLIHLKRPTGLSASSAPHTSVTDTAQTPHALQPPIPLSSERSELSFQVRLTWARPVQIPPNHDVAVQRLRAEDPP